MPTPRSATALPAPAGGKQRENSRDSATNPTKDAANRQAALTQIVTDTGAPAERTQHPPNPNQPAAPVKTPARQSQPPLRRNTGIRSIGAAASTVAPPACSAPVHASRQAVPAGR